MADQIKATPRNSVLGLFSDIVNLPLQYMSAPERTQQSQGAAQFLYGTGIPQTLERMSYGDSLFTGSGMTLRPREETINAAMNVAPLAPVAGRVASRTGRAVGRMAGEEINAAMTGQPTKTFLGQITPRPLRMTDTSYRGQHTAPSPEFGAPLHDLTGGGQMYPADVYSEKAAQYYGSGNRKADTEAFNLAKRVRGNPDAEVTMYRAVPKNADITNINAGDWVTLSKEYAKNHGESVLGNDYKILSQKVKAKELWTNADSIQEFGYQPQQLNAPQQAALDLAQQRAALPIEQGGLGLPANNTAADRAKAMGFDVEAYRGTTGDIESSVIPSDFFGSNYFGKGINLTTSAKDASKYASTDVGINTDLVGKAELMSEKLGISYPEAKAQLTSGGGTVIPISANIDNPLVIGAQKIQAPESVIRYALKESGYSGDVEKLVKQFKDANTGFEQFELIKSKQATPFYQNLSSLMNKNGLMIDESLSPKSEGGMHYVASLPDQIRSRFAAFDPFRKDVATATAMGVALPDLLAQPVNRYELPQETTPMYTDPFGNTIGSSIR